MSSGSTVDTERQQHVELLRCVGQFPETAAILELKKYPQLLDRYITCETQDEGCGGDCGCGYQLEAYSSWQHKMDLDKLCASLQTVECEHQLHSNMYPVSAGTKLIHMAAVFGKLEVLMFLQDQGCSLRSKTIQSKMFPLDLAIEHSRFNVCKYLLAQTELLIRAAEAQSLLLLAVRSGVQEIVEQILKIPNLHFPSVAQKAIEDALRLTPSSVAKSLTSLFLQMYPDVSLGALQASIQINDLDFFQTILKARLAQGPLFPERVCMNSRSIDIFNKMDLDNKERCVEIAVITAMPDDDPAILQLILEQETGEISMTKAILLATCNNAVNLLQCLVSHAVKHHKMETRPQNYRALDWALALGYTECAAILHGGKGPIPCLRSDFPPPIPLVWNFDFVRALPTDPFGWPALPSREAFVIKGRQFLTFQKQITKRLLEQGHGINGWTVEKFTALHYAIDAASTEKAGIDFLLQHGADPNVNSGAPSPFWYAVEKNSEENIQDLLYYNAEMEIFHQITSRCLVYYFNEKLPNFDIHQRRSALFVCICNLAQNFQGNVDTLKLLLNAGYNVYPEVVEIKRLLGVLKKGKVVKKIRSVIFDHLETPRSLQELCRNCIRRACGVKIHQFVESMHLPRQIQDVLLLRDVLNMEWIIDRKKIKDFP